MEAARKNYGFIAPEHLFLGMLWLQLTGKPLNSVEKVLNVLELSSRNLFIVTSDFIKSQEPEIYYDLPLTKAANAIIENVSNTGEIIFPTDGRLLLSFLSLSQDEYPEVKDLQIFLSNNGLTYQRIYEILKAEYDAEQEYAMISEIYSMLEDKLKTDHDEAFNTPTEKPKSKLVFKNTQPISLYFDKKQFSTEEIARMISILSEIYKSVSGDELEIEGMNRFEFFSSFNPVSF